MNNNNDKLLYLKALTKDIQSDKVAKEIKEAIDYLNKTEGFLHLDLHQEQKPINPEKDLIEGRTFILKNVEDFLNTAVDYSMVDKINDILGGWEYRVRK